MTAFRPGDAEDMLHNYGSKLGNSLPQKAGIFVLLIVVLLLLWASVQIWLMPQPYGKAIWRRSRRLHRN